MSYLERNWLDLQWTPWIAFDGPRSNWLTLPNVSGLYRVKPKNSYSLAYVGETGLGLRDRLNVLRRGTMAELMPFNDPHTAAPNLWAWRQEEHWDYECSAATFSKSRLERKTMECFLLWRYRLEKGESTLCNHGRFHKNYQKSSDRSKNQRGYRLSESQTNPSWGPSLKPLTLHGQPQDIDWMEIQWSTNISLKRQNSSKVPNSPGLYRIVDFNQNSLVYVGESRNLHNRFMQHSRAFANSLFSFSKSPDSIRKYQLHEMENDLIAAYYNQTSEVPKHQFSNKKGKP
jgi:hypothetical protein